ncbi:MAG TPA: hypothetical protein PLY70_01070, partial [Saprospiraceae bacterium]|nr:hypothetical protein [Saprospiraceae bacterium]
FSKVESQDNDVNELQNLSLLMLTLIGKCNDVDALPEYHKIKRLKQLFQFLQPSTTELEGPTPPPKLYS